MKGSEWFERVKHLGSDRKALMLKVLEAVQEGWAMHWPTVAVKSGPVTFYAARDYFAIGEPDDYLLVPLDPITAQRIADEWDMRLPTKGMVLATHAAADQRLPADTLPMTPEQGYPYSADMYHVRRLPVQQQRVNALMSAPCPAGTAQLISGHKKDVVRSNVLERHPGKLAFFGWFLSTGRAIQGPYVGSAHVDTYWDYAHGVRFIEHFVDVDGVGRMPLDDALQDPELHKHLQAVDSLGGHVEPLRVLRYKLPDDGDIYAELEAQAKLPTWPELGLRDGYADGDPKRPAVLKWQQLIGATADGKYGPNTQAKTRAWQVAHGLTADGRVTGNDWAAALDDAELKLDELPLPTVQATNFTRVPGGRKDVRWIVLHTMEAAEHPGTAENVAAWFASGKNAPQASAHYCVDNDSAVLCVPEEHVAWHAKKGNRYGVGIELAGYARQDAKGWDDDYSQDMLRIAAKLCASICKRWGIPAEYIGQEGLKDGRLGFCYHRDVTLAFKVVGGHYDPGQHFPIEEFLALVQAELTQLLAA